MSFFNHLHLFLSHKIVNFSLFVCLFVFGGGGYSAARERFMIRLTKLVLFKHSPEMNSLTHAVHSFSLLSLRCFLVLSFSPLSLVSLYLSFSHPLFLLSLSPVLHSHTHTTTFSLSPHIPLLFLSVYPAFTFFIFPFFLSPSLSISLSQWSIYVFRAITGD